MITGMLKKLFGSSNDRIIKRYRQRVLDINKLEPKFEAMSDEELKSVAKEYQEQIQGGESLDKMLPEVFALVREASIRSLGMRPYDVQILGGICLHEGNIAEMKTGEGKTLTATMPVVLNAFTGKGVHLITVNDYLATRDAAWMGVIYNFLGLTVGVIVPNMDEEKRKEAYQCDITYGVNSEFGFDYLRDNMKYFTKDKVQRKHYYTIIDEVDSILVDEARTPLIISGPSEGDTNIYHKANAVILQLQADVDYKVDEKERTSVFTEEGALRAEKIIGSR